MPRDVYMRDRLADLQRRINALSVTMTAFQRQSERHRAASSSSRYDFDDVKDDLSTQTLFRDVGSLKSPTNFGFSVIFDSYEDDKDLESPGFPAVFDSYEEDGELTTESVVLDNGLLELPSDCEVPPVFDSYHDEDSDLGEPMFDDYEDHWVESDLNPCFDVYPVEEDKNLAMEEIFQQVPLLDDPLTSTYFGFFPPVFDIYETEDSDNEEDDCELQQMFSEGAVVLGIVTENSKLVTDTSVKQISIKNLSLLPLQPSFTENETSKMTIIFPHIHKLGLKLAPWEHHTLFDKLGKSKQVKNAHQMFDEMTKQQALWYSPPILSFDPGVYIKLDTLLPMSGYLLTNHIKLNFLHIFDVCEEVEVTIVENLVFSILQQSLVSLGAYKLFAEMSQQVSRVCDVILLTIAKGIFKVKSIAGAAHFGDENCDNKMINHFVTTFNRKHEKDPNIRIRMRALNLLYGMCDVSNANDIDEYLHNRQLDVYYCEIMRRVFGSNIFVFGTQGLGAEIAKILAAGINSISFRNEQSVELWDLSDKGYAESSIDFDSPPLIDVYNDEEEILVFCLPVFDQLVQMEEQGEIREVYDVLQSLGCIAQQSSAGTTILAFDSPVCPWKCKDGRVLNRAGHIEAFVGFSILTGFRPAAVLSKVLDGDGLMNRLRRKQFYHIYDGFLFYVRLSSHPNEESICEFHGTLHFQVSVLTGTFRDFTQTRVNHVSEYCYIHELVWKELWKFEDGLSKCDFKTKVCCYLVKMRMRLLLWDTRQDMPFEVLPIVLLSRVTLVTAAARMILSVLVKFIDGLHRRPFDQANNLKLACALLDNSFMKIHFALFFNQDIVFELIMLALQDEDLDPTNMETVDLEEKMAGVSDSTFVVVCTLIQRLPIQNSRTNFFQGREDDAI